MENGRKKETDRDLEVIYRDLINAMVFHHRHHWIRRNEMEIGLEECRGNKRRTRNRDRISVLSGLIGVSFLFFVSLSLSRRN